MDMMEAVRDLSEKEFLELADVIYRMGFSDCAHIVCTTQEQRKAKLKCRIEEWLEI